jgi:excisionase family DNA binding protein
VVAQRRVLEVARPMWTGRRCASPPPRNCESLVMETPSGGNPFGGWGDGVSSAGLPSFDGKLTFLLTMSETASALRVSRRFVYDLVDSGDLAIVKMGRATRFAVPDVQRLVAERLTAARLAAERRAAQRASKAKKPVTASGTHRTGSVVPEIELVVKRWMTKRVGAPYIPCMGFWAKPPAEAGPSVPEVR